MSVICSICGGTHITCAAIVDPNTKQFINFGYEAWLDGQCDNCGNVTLTDPKQVQDEIDCQHRIFKSRHPTEPRFAVVEYINTSNYEESRKGYIKLKGGKTSANSSRIIASCNSIEELNAMTVPSENREFTIIGCSGFLSEII